MLTRLTVACALLVAAPAFAETSPPAAAPEAPVVEFASDAFAPVSDEELDQARGGADYHLLTQALTNQALTAASTGNTVQGATVGSGSISIDGEAFRGFNGIGNFVVNTGHNNVLQGSLSVQVVVVPTPGT